MKYSNKDLLKIETNAKKDIKNLTHITNKTTLSTEDTVKLGLCKHFVRFAVSKKLKIKNMAKMLSLPSSRLSEIVNYKIDKFSADFLLRHLSSLAEFDSQIKEYLNFFGKAAEMQTLPVSTMKKLTKNIEHINKRAAEHASHKMTSEDKKWLNFG